MVLSLAKINWKITERNDNKRMAKQALPEGILQDNDIPYLDDGNKMHMLDVYYPEGAYEDLPVIIDIHGGGWMYGTKELNKIYCLYLAKRGFVVFNMNYRLVPETTIPNQLRDISAALIKIEKLIESYRCDKSRVYLTGDSAGGQLAGFTACIQNSARLQEVFDFKPSGIDFAAVGLTSPAPFLDFGGITNVYTKVMTSEKEKEALGKYLNFDALLEVSKIPPTFFVTSSGDFIARAQTRKAYNAIVKSGTSAKLVDWEKTGGKNLPHVFSVLEPMSDAGAKSIDDMIEFFLTHSVKPATATK